MAYTKQITIMNDPALEQITSMIEGNTSLAANSSYLEILRRMQLGEWSEVIPLIKLLKAQYPTAKELELLLAEVKLRAEYDANWDGKIKARRTTLNLPRLASRVVPVALIALLAFAIIFYVGQTRRVSAQNESRDALMAQANQAMINSEFQNAYDLYAELLVDEPSDQSALAGQDEAKRMMALDIEYSEILTQIDSGDFERALAELANLQEKSPGFRDVPILIEQLTNISSVEEAYAAAEVAYNNQDWAEAISYYERVRQIDSTYRSDVVTDNLLNSYLSRALDNIERSPEEGADLQLAQTQFQKVLKLEIGHPIAKAEGEFLDAYLDGMNGLEDGNLKQGIEELLPIYQTRPEYLDGYLAQSLYDAYIQLGDESEAEGDLRRAMGYYGKAAALRVTTRSVALEGLRRVSLALTPTPTVTPTSPPPTPAPTATPIPPTMADFSGWILFRSNRNGGAGLFVMRPDGTDVQLAPDQTLENFAALYDEEKFSPDGNARLYVAKQKVGESTTYQIYKERVDLPADWNRTFRMTDLNGTSYDPVWGPDNKTIAFVSNVTGSDEIWTINTEGGDPKQLTYNDWPWDKHPTWSPDGTQILFWSNRTGMRQLWIMDRDGGNQRELTTEYENWDPVWLK